MAQHALVCPFLNSDPVYALGVEFGMLHARMQHGDEDVVADYFCIDNQEQILLLANRLGWGVRKMKKWDRGWFWCVLEKRSPDASDGVGAD